MNDGLVCECWKGIENPADDSRNGMFGNHDEKADEF